MSNVAAPTQTRPEMPAEDAFAAARRFMVDGQLRPNRVTDPLLLAAMGRLPRHLFVAPAQASLAHADRDLAFPAGRVMIQPMMLARLIQLLALRDGDRLLLIGAGTGYSSAVAASLGARVVALESESGLAAAAARLLPALLPPGAATLVEGPLEQGHAAGAPYDAILIEGEIPAIPAALVAQLAEGGRLVTVLAGGARGRGARAVIGRKAGESFSLLDAFDCTTAPLAAFQPRQGFVF